MKVTTSGLLKMALPITPGKSSKSNLSRSFGIGSSLSEVFTCFWTTRLLKLREKAEGLWKLGFRHQKVSTHRAALLPARETLPDSLEQLAQDALRIERVRYNAHAYHLLSIHTLRSYIPSDRLCRASEVSSQRLSRRSPGQECPAHGDSGGCA